MRSKRMRGYGSWSIGWNEANKKSTPSPSSNNGCIWILIGLGVLFFISSIKVAIDTGNLFSICLGIAFVAGIMNGLNKRRPQ